MALLWVIYSCFISMVVSIEWWSFLSYYCIIVSNIMVVLGCIHWRFAWWWRILKILLVVETVSISILCAQSFLFYSLIYLFFYFVALIDFWRGFWNINHCWGVRGLIDGIWGWLKAILKWNFEVFTYRIGQVVKKIDQVKLLFENWNLDTKGSIP